MKAILGKKVGMTQIFDENGSVIPVTVLEAGPCTVVQVKNEETDGYKAVQLGFGDVKEKHVTKPAKGHFNKAKVAPKKHIREFRFENIDDFKVGNELKADVFQAEDIVDNNLNDEEVKRYIKFCEDNCFDTRNNIYDHKTEEDREKFKLLVLRASARPETGNAGFLRRHYYE